MFGPFSVQVSTTLLFASNDKRNHSRKTNMGINDDMFAFSFFHSTVVRHPLTFRACLSPRPVQ